MFKISSNQLISNYHFKTSKISIHLKSKSKIPSEYLTIFRGLADDSGVSPRSGVSRRHITPHYDTNPPNLPINLMQINFVSSQYSSQPPATGEQHCDQLSSNNQRIYHNYTLHVYCLLSTVFTIKLIFMLLLTRS